MKISTNITMSSITSSSSSIETQVQTPIKKSVQFNQKVRVARTFAQEDYDRSSILPSPLIRQDIIDFNVFKKEMLSNCLVEQKIRFWKKESVQKVAVKLEIDTRFNDNSKDVFFEHQAIEIWANSPTVACV